MEDDKLSMWITVLDILMGLAVISGMIVGIIFFSTLAKASTVPGDISSVSENAVLASNEPTVISSNYISGNTLSGGISYDQGDQIIFLLFCILFMLVFSWCHERIRNGVRSTKHTH